MASNCLTTGFLFFEASAGLAVEAEAFFLFLEDCGVGLEDFAVGLEDLGVGLEDFRVSLADFGVGLEDFRVRLEDFGVGSEPEAALFACNLFERREEGVCGGSFLTGTGVLGLCPWRLRLEVVVLVISDFSVKRK